MRELSRRRWIARARRGLPLLILLGLPGAGFLWHFWRPHVMRVIVSGPPPVVVAKGGVPAYGPPWPPTEDDWKQVFARSSWVYPLPGPNRRMPRPDSHIFGAERKMDHAPECGKGHCGVDLGGELWGEHVYAVHDGVVDRVVRAGNEEHGGLYIRLSHFGGMVFTQYFHLAAIARGLAPGVHVKAGDVIGLVGDTGVKDGGMHLTFTLSTRPSSEYPEVLMDPEPLMLDWPLRREPYGTVLGLVTAVWAPPHPTLTPHPPRRPPRARPVKAEPASEPAETEPDSASFGD